ncbi:MAG: DUF2851 family protein [Salinivirgaceae bacterium]
MQESFLQYLWKYSLYSNQPLSLVGGAPIEVINAGEHNTNSGPDFFNAKIKIGETVWAGNLEIHVRSSDWLKHHHESDAAYNNVILHVVAQHDTEIKRPNGEPLPVLELQAPKGLYEQYLYLMQNNGWVPCEAFIAKIDDFAIFQWKESLLVERLHEKAELINERFTRNNNHWEETFYQTLAANFGFKTNAQPFEMLARSLLLTHLAKHKDQLNLIEAMLFGQSGLLPKKNDDNYTHQLITDFDHFSNKFALKPMSSHLWKFSRLRPVNFPTIRLAQFAALVHSSSSLLSKILDAADYHDLAALFQVKASTFWDTHYVFDKKSPFREKHLGEDAFHNILINTLAPFLFFYGNIRKQPSLTEKAMEWLSKVPPEQNAIIEHWNQLGMKSENAFDTQALIQLKNNYCSHRRCLNCQIGNQVIRHRF